MLLFALCGTLWLASRPSMDPSSRIDEPPITGDPPNPIDPPSGCRFHTRCPEAIPDCARIDPDLREVSPSHTVACIRVPGWFEAETKSQ